MGFEYFVRPDGDLMAADESSLSDLVEATFGHLASVTPPSTTS